MANLNLTGQQAEYTDIAPKLVKAKNLMLQRKPIWDKIPLEKKKAWVTSDKDPIMTLCYDIWQWLDNNFFGDEHRHG